MLELMNEEAPKLLEAWASKPCITPVLDYEVSQNDYRTHIRWLHGAFECDRAKFDTIYNTLSEFLFKSKAPFILQSDEIGNKTNMYESKVRLLVINDSTFTYAKFVWTEQIERYRVALLLMATE